MQENTHRQLNKIIQILNEQIKKFNMEIGTIKKKNSTEALEQMNNITELKNSVLTVDLIMQKKELVNTKIGHLKLTN